MKEKYLVSVSKIEDIGEDNLTFEIYNTSGADDIRLGQYSVDSEGYVNIELDNYLALYSKELKAKALSTLRKNGLEYILGDETEKILKGVEETESYGTFDRKEERWKRANEYIDSKNLKVDIIPVDLLDLDEEDTHHKQR